MPNHREGNARFLLAILLIAAGAQASCSADPTAPREEVSVTQQALTASDPVQAAVQKAAQAQLKGQLDSIPAGTERQIGFLSREEFAEAKVGAPYEMFSVVADGSVQSLDAWRVPVLVKGEFRSLLDMSKSGSDYAVYAIGAAVLAKELGQVEQANGVAADSPRSLLRAFKQTADFVVYDLTPREPKNRAQLKIHPLNSAQQSLDKKIKSTGPNANTVAPRANGRLTELTITEVQSLLGD